MVLARLAIKIINSMTLGPITRFEDITRGPFVNLYFQQNSTSNQSYTSLSAVSIKLLYFRLNINVGLLFIFHKMKGHMTSFRDLIK